MNDTTNTTVNNTTFSGAGLVFFQQDGSVGGFVRDGSFQYQLRGVIKGDEVILSGVEYGLRYKKVEQKTDRHPVGKGTLLNKKTGETVPVAVFANKLSDGRRVHGISLSGSDSLVVDAPF
jgi:hypothetical protein